MAPAKNNIRVQVRAIATVRRKFCKTPAQSKPRIEAERWRL